MATETNEETRPLTDLSDGSDLSDNREKTADTRDQKDSGRFNQDSETPLLDKKEDANDFQLTDLTREEAAKRDQAAEKAEAERLERAKEEARHNAPELPMESQNVGEIPAMTEDEYLAKQGLSMPVSDYMTDKQKIPHGETESQRKQRMREADRIANEYVEARKKAKAEYRRKIENGELREPTVIEKLEKAAAGHPDNESVQAARRALEKRRKKQAAEKREQSDNSDNRGEPADAQGSGERQYSIAGEAGLRRLSWQSKEALRRLEDLELAKRFHKHGKEMDAIKFQTGWELGKDGKWRTELPDLKVKPGIDMLLLAKKNPKLLDIVDAPEIFNAYPEIADTPVRVAIFKNEAGEAMDSVAAAYDYGDDCFYISPGYVLKNEDEVNSVLTHEVQHKIQRIEGFAPGGNPEQFLGKSEQLKEDVAAFRKKADASEKYRRFEQLDRQFGKMFSKGTDAEIDSWQSRFGKEYDTLYDDPEVKAINEGKLDIVKQHGNSIRVLQLLENPNDTEAWKTIALEDRAYKIRQYQRLAGEVEARNAQTRMNMPLEKRLKTLLSRTEDVAEEDKIYLEKAVGEAMMTVGDHVREIIDSVPVEDTSIELLSRSPNTEEIVKKVFEGFPRTVIAADGKNILLHNPQILFDKNTGEEIIESDAKRMQNRLDHLTRGGEEHKSTNFDRRKFKWLPRTPETLQKAQFKLQANNCLGYVRRYQEGFHLVLVSPDGVAYYETGIDNALVSQFKENFTGSKGDFIVVWEGGRFTDSTISRLPATDQSGAPLPVTNHDTVSPSSADVKAGSEENAKKSENRTNSRTDGADEDVQYSLKQHRQVNPIVVDGQVRAEYADLLNDREYTPETIGQWQDRAIEWIERQGGVVQAAEQIANDTEHSERHVATLVRRMVRNSDQALSIPAEQREKIELKNIDDGTAWGREGAARRLAALTLSSMARVRALFRKLHENMPDAEDHPEGETTCNRGQPVLYCIRIRRSQRKGNSHAERKIRMRLVGMRLGGRRSSGGLSQKP